LENQEVTQNENEFFVEDDPIMQSATDALFMLSKLGKISIKAKGLYMPNAVAIANIITENFLKNNSKVEKINLDSKISDRDGRMISNIEIILLKN
jgi:DNA-binding protein Alba